MKSFNYGVVILVGLVAISFLILWHTSINPMGATDVFLGNGAFEIIAAAAYICFESIVGFFRGKDE